MSLNTVRNFYGLCFVKKFSLGPKERTSNPKKFFLGPKKILYKAQLIEISTQQSVTFFTNLGLLSREPTILYRQPYFAGGGMEMIFMDSDAGLISEKRMITLIF